jgi:xanthine dehydrogenase YagS FAD-binding subunit
VAVNPSDLAPALIALDGRVRVTKSHQGTREFPVETLYNLPENSRRRQTILEKDEMVVEIRIPLPSERFTGRYLKVMDREEWSFALVGVAVGIEWEGNLVKQARVVLGSVAGKPWRALEAEKRLASHRIDESLAEEVGEAAVSESVALKWNAYKIPMAKNLVKRAVLDIRPLL